MTEKSCATCTYRFRATVSDEPCRHCTVYDQWKPATASEMIAPGVCHAIDRLRQQIHDAKACCGSCRHVMSPPNVDPCVSCLDESNPRQTVRRNWEPKPLVAPWIVPPERQQGKTVIMERKMTEFLTDNPDATVAVFKGHEVRIEKPVQGDLLCDICGGPAGRHTRCPACVALDAAVRENPLGARKVLRAINQELFAKAR